MDFMDLSLYLLALGLVLVGLAGAILPMLPGLPFVFGGLWLAAWTDEYRHVGIFTLVILGVLLAIGLALDFIAGSIGTKRVGASPQAVTGALLGTVVGMFFGIPGLLLGPFVGAVLGELYARRSLGQAAASGIGAWVGLLLGTITKLVIGFMMVGGFALDWLIDL